MAAFTPRTVFPLLESLPRSYYLGHHAAGLARMQTLCSQIDLIVECRDYRIPLTSRNPLFEERLAGTERLIVYTKKDLAWDGGARSDKKLRHNLLRSFHAPSHVLFTDHTNARDMRDVLAQIRTAATRQSRLTGTHVMVVGMPNVGKSSLLNALRQEGLGGKRKKAAQTGAQPGVTRSIASSVKIMEANEVGGGGVYLLDTPGVFMPYVPDAEAMLKLALCGSVKDSIISPVTLADYLLYHINLKAPQAYASYAPAPTNEIVEVLGKIASKTGRLRKGGELDLEAAALWMIQQWRNGRLGSFLLDDVSQDSLEMYKQQRVVWAASPSQLRKAEKQIAREKAHVTESSLVG